MKQELYHTDSNVSRSQGKEQRRQEEIEIWNDENRPVGLNG